MSLKTGIVGCGKVGDFHAKAYSQLGSSAFAAVCDADIDRARAFAERYHVRAYADVAEMIQTEGLDVVSICTPHPAHCGKVHIFGENGAKADPYLVLKDFPAYDECHKRMSEKYQDKNAWRKMAVMNTACSGFFSSDRTIEEYNEKIWKLSKIKTED